ncbi:MAG: acyl-CoA thioesterase [Chthoniobacterales bacterium]
MVDRTQICEELQVMYYDTDAGGVVHNIVYLRFIELARTKLAIQLGMSFDEIKRTNIHPVVVRTEIDYRKPARLGDMLKVRGHLGEVKGVRFWVHFEIVRSSDEVVLVTSQQALALVQMPEGRLLRLPKGFPKEAGLSASV